MRTTTKKQPSNTRKDEKKRKKKKLSWTQKVLLCKTYNISLGNMLLEYSVSICFPVFSQFQKDQVVSYEFSMFVEAVVLPWDLFLSGKNPTKVSKDQNEEPMEHYDSRNNHEYGSHKRCKIDHAWSRPLSSGFRDKSIPGIGLCSYMSGCSSANEQDPVEIPCLACFGSGSLVSSGKLYCTEATLKFGTGYKPSALKVLLEFKSESFVKYQVCFVFSFSVTYWCRGYKTSLIVVIFQFPS